MMDCQNNPSSSAEAGGDAAAGDAGGCAAVATVGPGPATCTSTEPDAPAVRSTSAAAPSRYPVAHDPRDVCQFRIAARVHGPNRPSAPPGFEPARLQAELDLTPRRSVEA